MAMQKLTIGSIVTIAVIGLFVSALGAMTATLTLPNTATISASTGINIYSDPSCTTPVTSINWGTLTPGQQATQTFFVKNTGSVRVTLSMATGNWNPSTAQQYITVGWNYSGSILNAGSSIPVRFTLTISPTVSGITTFSFTINITCTEQT